MWRVEGTRRVATRLARFGLRIRERYDRAFARLAEDPLAGELPSGYEGLRSFPVTTPGGEHRIIYQIKPEGQVVLVVLVGTREEIYRLLERSGIG